MVAVVDETFGDLRQIVERDLGPQPSTADLDSLFQKWLHFSARRIPRRPREVAVSTEVQAHKATYPAIREIEERLRRGDDVSAWLSDSIRLKKDKPFADMMFNDWQVVHFHLSQVYVKPDKTGRTGPLLYSFVSSDRAVLLDVQPHGAWGMRHLLRILRRTSPDDILKSRIEGAVGLEKDYTDEEVVRLRKRSINVLFELDGEFYAAPGLGLSLSGHAIRHRFFADRMFATIQEIKASMGSNSAPAHIMQSIWGQIGVPVRLGVNEFSGEITFVDRNRDLLIGGMPVIE